MLSTAVVIGNIMSWVLFGAVVGLVVHLANNSRIKGGVMASIGWGISGSMLGGIIATGLFGKSFANGTLAGLILALIGGIVLTLAARVFFKEQHHIKTSQTYLRRGEVR